jgi:hypothetical protein
MELDLTALVLARIQFAFTVSSTSSFQRFPLALRATWQCSKGFG